MKQSEEQIQSTALSVVAVLYPDCLISLSLSGIQLLGSAQEKAKIIAVQKRSGFRKGLPDVTVFLPDIALNLEYKTPTGVQSIHQMEVESILSNLGHHYYIVRSLDDTFDAIAAHTSVRYRTQCLNSILDLSKQSLTEPLMMFPVGAPTTEVKQLLKEKYRLI